MLRSVILAASRSPRVERLVAALPATRDLAHRFVAGVDADDALHAATDAIGGGRSVTLEHLGPATHTVEAATAIRDEYVELLTRLAAAGLTPAGDVTVRLSALGRRFDERFAYDNARAVCAAAAAAGTSVTLGMEDHTTTDPTLDVLLKLREEYPATGATLQAYLRRTESDCRDLAAAGSRVRLCRGGYREPESVAYRSARDIGKSYVRCAKVLLAGDGYPMFATADPRLIAIIEDRSRWFDRRPDQFEFQLRYGVRVEEQERLVTQGYTVRIQIPYGRDWYPHLMRRLAVRPAVLGRALLPAN